MEFDELERLRVKNLELERVNSLLREQLETYRTSYFGERDIKTILMDRYDKLNSKYCKLIRKYKKLINNHDEIIKSFSKVQYALQCYYLTKNKLENEPEVCYTIRCNAAFAQLVRKTDDMLTLLAACGLIDMPCDTVVSSK